jgi:hypothetical protein
MAASLSMTASGDRSDSLPYSPTTQQMTWRGNMWCVRCNSMSKNPQEHTGTSRHFDIGSVPLSLARKPSPATHGPHLEQHARQLWSLQHVEVGGHGPGAQVLVGALVIVTRALGHQPGQAVGYAGWHDLSCMWASRSRRQCHAPLA